MSTEVAVVILAGGEGRRIGGGKPLRMLGGERLIERALTQARQWSDCVAVAVREEAQTPGAPPLRDEPGVEGPLGGLVAGLRFARAQGHELLLTIPADMPFLPPELLDRLRNAIGDRGCALASSGGHLHPVCGLWWTSALDRVPEYLAGASRSLKGFAAMIGFVYIEWAFESEDPFFNINSPDDLTEAERRLTR